MAKLIYYVYYENHKFLKAATTINAVGYIYKTLIINKFY